MTERDVLRRAKEVLLQRGWHRGEFCSDLTGKAGRVCLVGALGVAVNGQPFCDSNDGTVPAARVIRDQLGALGRAYGLVALPMWNDDEAGSIDDVIALLDRAIASLPSGEVVETQELTHA